MKLCASFHHHMWIQTGVTVQKRLSWVLTSETLTFDLWPFAWASLLSLVITPEDFMMIRWWEHGQKGVTDRQTYRQTDGWTIHRAAWSQLKTSAASPANATLPGSNALKWWPCRGPPPPHAPCVLGLWHLSYRLFIENVIQLYWEMLSGKSFPANASTSCPDVHHNNFNLWQIKGYFWL